MAHRIQKEITIGVPTIFGVLTTLGVGLVLRLLFPFKNLSVAQEQAFVMFITFGLAYSLVVAVSMAVSKRDAIIVMLAATVIWGIFVENQMAIGMIRFLVFAILVTLSINGAYGQTQGLRAVTRTLAVTLIAGLACGTGGLLFYGVGLRSHVADTLSGQSGGGFTWGFALGLAVGAGVTTGVEVVACLTRRAK